jgi:hypothetical protein
MYNWHLDNIYQCAISLFIYLFNYNNNISRINNIVCLGDQA